MADRTPSLEQLSRLVGTKEVASAFGMKPESVHLALYRGTFPVEPYRLRSRGGRITLRWDPVEVVQAFAGGAA